MKVLPIKTGSQGNGIILQDGDSCIMLDCGVPPKKVVEKYGLLNVKLCLVTHEHSDHAKDARKWSERAFIYCTAGTLQAIKKKGMECVLRADMRCQTVTYNWAFTPFKTTHDAAEPCGWLIVSPSGHTTVYCTDTAHIHYTFSNVDTWILEANYSDELLQNNVLNGKIKAHHAERIIANHMSIKNLSNYLKKQAIKDDANIYLCHLSNRNSDEKEFVKKIKSVTKCKNVKAI